MRPAGKVRPASKWGSGRRVTRLKDDRGRDLRGVRPAAGESAHRENTHSDRPEAPALAPHSAPRPCAWRICVPSMNSGAALLV